MLRNGMDVGRRGNARTLGGVALLVALILVPAAASAAPGGTGKQLRSALDEVMSVPDGPPGISLLIQRRGEKQFLRRGVANIETGTRPQRGQRYRIASMSKALSGAIALKLVSRDKLELDDTIGELLPGVLPLVDDVTLGQVLQHTGSVPDFIKDPAFLAELELDPTQYMTPLELVGFVAGTEPEFDPGERYEYSDTDNLVVGLMAEAATGMPYDGLLERHVYSKLGLGDTTLPDTIAMPDPYMRGYHVSAHAPPEDVSGALNPALAWASGGIVSTAVEVNRFFRAYVAGDLFKKRERRAQRQLVIGSSSPPGPGRNRAGLGLFRYKTHCGTVFGHTGSYPGYRVFAASTANGRRSVVFTANAQIVPGSGSQEVSDLIRHAQVDAVCHALR